MTEDEGQQILDSLQSGPGVLLDALQGVTGESAVRVPGPGKWSILQCVEHMALSEEYLLSRLLAAEKASSPLVDRDREARFILRATDRSKPAKAPEPVTPRGSFATLQDAVKDILSNRRRTVQFAQDHAQEDLRCWITSCPPFGTVNCQEVLLLMAAHLLRHAKQIEEAKALLSESLPPNIEQS
jgi:hypothetical protein